MYAGAARCAGVEARRVLRAASVFGETFLEVGCPQLARGKAHEGELGASLARMRAEELIVSRSDSRFASEEEFAFQHALVRDADYAALTERGRELGHRRGALGGTAGESDATSAQHYEGGALLPKSRRGTGQRGRRSTAATWTSPSNGLGAPWPVAPRASCSASLHDRGGSALLARPDGGGRAGRSARGCHCPERWPGVVLGAGATFMLRISSATSPGAVQILSELSSVVPTREAVTPFVKGCALAWGFLLCGMYDNAKAFLSRSTSSPRQPRPAGRGVAEFARSFGWPLRRRGAGVSRTRASEPAQLRERRRRARARPCCSLASGRASASSPVPRCARDIGRRTSAERSPRARGSGRCNAAVGILHGELGEHGVAARLATQAAEEFERQGTRSSGGFARLTPPRAQLALGDAHTAAAQAEAAREVFSSRRHSRASVQACSRKSSWSRSRLAARPLASEARAALAELGCVAEGEAHIRLNVRARALRIRAAARGVPGHSRSARAPAAARGRREGSQSAPAVPAQARAARAHLRAGSRLACRASLRFRRASG